MRPSRSRRLNNRTNRGRWNRPIGGRVGGQSSQDGVAPPLSGILHIQSDRRSDEESQARAFAAHHRDDRDRHGVFVPPDCEFGAIECLPGDLDRVPWRRSHDTGAMCCLGRRPVGWIRGAGTQDDQAGTNRQRRRQQAMQRRILRRRGPFDRHRSGSLPAPLTVSSLRRASRRRRQRPQSVDHPVAGGRWLSLGGHDHHAGTARNRSASQSPDERIRASRSTAPVEGDSTGLPRR